MSWILLIVVAYLALVAGMALLQRRFIYLPDRSVPDRGRAGATDALPVSIRTSDGLDLLAWHWPAAGARATVLYLHGNAGHIGHRAGKIRPLVDAGYGVLLLAYRGYGGNPGRPTEAGLLADGEAALAWLAHRRVGPIVLYGESLGCGVATALAGGPAVGGPAVGGIVLEAPFTSLVDVARRRYPILPVRLLLADRYPNSDRIASIDAPLLIIHGGRDTVIPVTHGRRLASLASSAAVTLAVIDAAGHNDLADYGAVERVVAWLGSVPLDQAVLGPA